MSLDRAVRMIGVPTRTRTSHHMSLWWNCHQRMMTATIGMTMAIHTINSIPPSSNHSSDLLDDKEFQDIAPKNIGERLICRSFLDPRIFERIRFPQVREKIFGILFPHEEVERPADRDVCCSVFNNDKPLHERIFWKDGEPAISRSEEHTSELQSP